MERRQTVRILRVIQRRYLIAVAAAVSLLLAACSSAASTSGGAAAAVANSPSTAAKSAPVTIKVSYLPVSDSAALFLAQKLGYFAKNGILVDPTLLFTGADTIPALVRGDVDIAAGGPSAGLFNAIGQTPGSIMIVGSMVTASSTPAQAGALNNVTGIYVRKDLFASGAINSAAKLVGKTVYLPSLGDQNEYYLYLYLKENGIALSKVHIGVLSGDAVTEADAGFRGKRIDAALEAPPVAQTEVKDGISVPLFTSEQVDPNAELAVWQANAAFVKAHPAAIVGFLKALGEANQYYDTALRDGPQSSQYKTVISTVASFLKLPASEVNLGPGLTTTLNVSDLTNIANFYALEGYVPKGDIQPASVYVNSSYLTQAGQ
jgi:NitT/TauT family transport system substrate-binding protein